jgi:gamma-butyrobetaine dioxygenase
MIKEIKCEKDQLAVSWSNGIQSAFPYIWLKDIDPQDFHPQTNERMFDLTQCDLAIKPADVVLDDKQISLQWPDQQQRSVYPVTLLAMYANSGHREDPAVVKRELWYKDFEVSRFASNKMTDAVAIKKMLLQLKRDGLVIITGLEREESGENFGDQIGFKRETNFGVMFEVINKAEPNNLAYTAVSLPLHTDLSNQELPPGYQFLHCVKNEAQGGESILADGFAIATDLQREQPEHFDLLASRKMPFRFHDKKCDIRFSHCVIGVKDNEIDQFIFNAHLAENVNGLQGDIVEYYRAYKALMTNIKQPKYALELKLQAGEMMIFDNKRVMHGRNSFDPTTGDRHLRGYYIDHTEVDSKIRMLS